MQTESLREKFTQSEELKPKVFRESLEAENTALSELATILMADTIDLDRVFIYFYISQQNETSKINLSLKMKINYLMSFFFFL